MGNEEKQLSFGQEFQGAKAEGTISDTPIVPNNSQGNGTEKIPGKRGRKPGQKNGEGKGVKKESKSPDSDSDFFATAKAAAEKAAEDAKNASNTNAPGVAQEPAKASLFSGYMMLVVLEAFVPKLMHKFLTKGLDPDKKGKPRKLDKEQMEQLKPIADEAAKKLFEKVDPVIGFFIAYAGVTLSNQIPE